MDILPKLLIVGLIAISLRVFLLNYQLNKYVRFLDNEVVLTATFNQELVNQTRKLHNQIIGIQNNEAILSNNMNLCFNMLKYCKRTRYNCGAKL